MKIMNNEMKKMIMKKMKNENDVMIVDDNEA